LLSRVTYELFIKYPLMSTKSIHDPNNKNSHCSLLKLSISNINLTLIRVRTRKLTNTFYFNNFIIQ